MDKKALLEALRDESVLLSARAKGAIEAYKAERMRQASEECCHLGRGDVVLIKYSSGELKAEITKMVYSEYDFKDYEGPAFFGYRFLKSGKKSKFAQALFTFEAFRSGHVVRVAKP